MCHKQGTPSLSAIVNYYYYFFSMIISSLFLSNIQVKQKEGKREVSLSSLLLSNYYYS